MMLTTTPHVGTFLNLRAKKKIIKEIARTSSYNRINV